MPLSKGLSRSFLNFRARLAAIAFLKPNFDFVQKVILTKLSEKRRNYVSYGSCEENHSIFECRM